MYSSYTFIGPQLQDLKRVNVHFAYAVLLMREALSAL